MWMVGMVGMWGCGDVAMANAGQLSQEKGMGGTM